MHMFSSIEPSSGQALVVYTCQQTTRPTYLAADWSKLKPVEQSGRYTIRHWWRKLWEVDAVGEGRAAVLKPPFVQLVLQLAEQ